MGWSNGLNSNSVECPGLSFYFPEMGNVMEKLIATLQEASYHIHSGWTGLEQLCNFRHYPGFTVGHLPARF